MRIVILIKLHMVRDITVPLQDVVNHFRSIRDLTVRFAYVSRKDSWTMSPYCSDSLITSCCLVSLNELPNMKTTLTSSISTWSRAQVSLMVCLCWTFPTAEQTTTSKRMSSVIGSDFWSQTPFGVILVVFMSGSTSLWTSLVWFAGQTNTIAKILKDRKYHQKVIIFC